MTAAGECFTGNQDSAPIAADCTTAFGSGTGGNACYACIGTEESSTSWGAFVIFTVPTATGASTTTELEMLNLGGCIAEEDKTAAGQKCATDFDELMECEVAACANYCPVSGDSDTAGITALFGDNTAANPGCLTNADTAVCATYVTALNTDCATESNDAGTGAYDKCVVIMNTYNVATPTAAATSAYMGEICGGAS
jgi:hypothetical protein